MNTENFDISVSDIRVEVTLKDIKNIHLAVYPPDGQVRLSAPKTKSKESLRMFVINKLGWIRKHKKDIKNQVRETDRKFIQGESHWVDGQRLRLNIIEHDEPPSVSIRNKKYIDLLIRPESSKEKKEQIIKGWYREQLKDKIPSLIDKWEKKLGVNVKQWGVRQMKTKWGSCNTEAQRIWLNLELAKKAPELLDYVILHEMAHLIERNHNDRYKAILDEHMPTWKTRREKLNEVTF